MPDPINKPYLDRPESLKMAKGQAVSHNPAKSLDEIYGPRGEVIGQAVNGGIRNPREIVIPTGSTLVRFGSAPLVPHVAGGAWWLDWANYKKVERYADAKKVAITVAVRVLCAVPAEWSDMTMVIQARTFQPLSAYAGEGNAAFATNQFHITSTVNPRTFSKVPVEQLFIPGLSSPDLRRASIMVTGHGLMPTQDSKRGYVPERSISRR